MSPLSVLQHLVGRPLVRHLADRALGRFARRRVRKLDWMAVGRVQAQTLLRLVRQARRTRFGRDHDFDRIRTVADYQARVPLRDYEAFWTRYWSEAFPFLAGVTWPSSCPYLALSSGTTSGTTKYIPVSPEMLRSNRRAALTTLALFLAAHPGTPLFAGRVFFLGGSTDLQELSASEKQTSKIGNARSPLSVRAGDLSGIAAREVPPLLRPFTFPPLETALLQDWEQKLTLLAQQSCSLPITAVSGVPSWLLVLFDRLRQITGKESVADVWPSLRLVIHGGTHFEPYRALFRKEVGSSAVHFLETYPASEGFIATEDPRQGLLRLIPDHGIFFEFVPVQELDARSPTRHTVANLELGVQYAVVLATCAGLWSYVLGDTVCFERRDPPLLRFTGRTRYFLSAFGEHLISEEIERAVARAAEVAGAAVVDFHVGPVFPGSAGSPGRHRYLVEFAQGHVDLPRFGAELDQALSNLNEDYRAHRRGDLTILPPEIYPVRRGGFADWLRSRGQLGGQHKVPRMDNSGRLTEELTRFFQKE